MENKFAWYDSGWLSNYLYAKEFIAKHHPSKLDNFILHFNELRTDPEFQVREIEGLLNIEKLKLIRNAINEIPLNRMELHETKDFGRFIVRDYPLFLQLQADLTDLVSELAGEALEPCYNFLSLYSRMGVCEPHMDAPSAKWTLDICIDQSEPWPIHFSQVVPWPEDRQNLGENWQQVIKSDPSLCFDTKLLKPGNALLFSGSSQWHYRDAIPQTTGRGFCNLLFFHYIPKGTSNLVRSKNWAHIFNIPELLQKQGIQVEIDSAK